MLETGFVIFLGVALLLLKLPRRALLIALNFPLTIDLAVSAMVLAIHWGTWSGTFAAATAGLLTSMLTSGLRFLIGYRSVSGYKPGVINLDAFERR